MERPTQDVPAKDIAKAAYAFGYAMVENYRTLYAQAVDASDPRYVGGFGIYRHYPDPATPENTDIVTPNNDTPYSWLWLDLRAEPYVVRVPAIDRYYILPFHDLYTLYAGYVGAVTTGPGPGNYLVAGPSWNGDLPQNITGVIRSATDVVGSLTRTALMTDGVDSLKAIQGAYAVTPLSEFVDAGAPAPAPAVDWPVWDEHAHTETLAFYDLLDFLLQFAPPLAEDADVRGPMASVGLDGLGSFRTEALDEADRGAFEVGLAEGIAELAEAAERTSSSIGLFGTHTEMARNYENRNLGAMKGLYGLPTNEAWYSGWLRDSDGNPPVGTKAYTVTFDADALPKARFIWSATMYRLPERLLVANSIDRYSIGDRTRGIMYGDDGSLELHISHDEPPEPGMRANWLPAPEGPFTVIIRAYGGDETIATGKYSLPRLVAR